ncbi:MAG: glucosidase, partial [Mycobacterium sp.]|nr:glucosidase [Mycobacterium sp.]
DGFRVELPRGSGQESTLAEVASDLTERLIGLYLPGPDGRLPAAGERAWPPGLMWLHEYFHGDTGAGLGAAHQTGWTAGLLNLLVGDGDGSQP